MQCSLPIFSQAFKEKRGRKVCKLSLSCLLNGRVVNDMHQTSVTLRLCLPYTTVPDSLCPDTKTIPDRVSGHT